MKALIIVLSFFQYVPYFISLYLGHSLPSISGWLCFSISLLVTMIASISLGTYSVVIACGLSLLCQISIIIIGIIRGVALRPDKVEKCILLFVCVSIVLWFITGKPSLAIYINIFVDVLGTAIILKKLCQLPATESPSTWFIGTLGSGLSVWYFYAESGAGFYYILTVFISNMSVFFLILSQEIIMRIDKKKEERITNTTE